MKLSRNFLPKAIAASLAVSSFNISAEEGFALEEIVVTAQKRAQSLQEVPISVNAVSGEFIEDSGISNLEELSSFVPNLNISKSPGANKIVIRGLGSSANPSFEQAVGLYVDGIYGGKSRQFQVPFMDVERVEVLRGPQGVLFGKNSIAGAVSIISAKPSDEFEAEITGKYELENNGYQVDSFVSGELAENLYGRLTLRHTDNGEYIDNIELNEDQPDAENEAVRGVLVWDVSDVTEITLKAEMAEMDQDGSGFQVSALDASAPASGPDALIQAAAIPLMQASGEDFDLNDKRTANAPNYLELESDNLALSIEHDISDNKLTYLLGFSQYDVQSATDLDFSALDLLSSEAKEEFNQVSHELRIASPVGETFEYVAGVYYLDREFEVTSVNNLDLGLVAGLPGGAGLALLSHSQYSDFKEDADAWSVFFQGTWNISETLRATLGARYTDETKEADYNYRSTVLGDTSTSHPAAGTSLLALGVADSDLARKRTETSFDPTFNLQWDFNESGMAYFTWTKATKAGGYNSTHNTPNPENFEFEEENAESLELGVKLDLLDGRARINAAYFYTEFEDLQVSSFDGSNFVTGNAAEATSQGVEVEASYALAEDLIVGSNLSWLDARYDSYLGSCPTNANEWSSSCVSSAGASQDLSGVRLEQAPEWSGTIFADYSTNISDSLIFSARIDAVYSDEYTLNANNDSYNVQDSFWKMNLRLALDSADERWTVALLGSNLTDETTANFGSSLYGIPGGYWSNVAPPRQIELSATYRFGK
ncbi:TonB-dependent receptor [Maricurvus nonylphenolicus]|uniref:TonB-dependent receptor n=1 Tax=Maricurvus nonylphenolicus TaxID=1008307 RepID=UPI0036F37BDA